MDIINSVKILADLIVAKYPVQEIIIFGSQAKGTANEESDIDVAFIMNGFDEYVDFTDLFQLKQKINNKIDPHVFEEKLHADFIVNEVKSVGIVVYKR